MKKNLLFIFMLAFVFANAQFTDDIESYPTGPVHQGHWTSWSGNAGAEDGIVSQDVAFSGSQSLLIQEGQGPQDCLLDFGHVAAAGQWACKWKMYIPTGSTGYFNVQGNIDLPNTGAAAQYLSGNITLVAGTLTDDNTNVTGSFPHDAWFDVKIEVDVDAAEYTIFVDNVSVGVQAYGNASDYFDGIDFFADIATNRYYIDDVVFDTAANVSVADLETLGFTAYPNPVENDLTLKANENITNVSIFNVLGQQVKNVQPNSLNPTINMSGLDSGAYFVKVSIGNTTGTIKVIK